MSYVSKLAEYKRSHEAYHRRILDNLDQKTFAQYSQQQPLTWLRSKVENPGVYLALNQLNPQLLGFICTGLSEADWQAIQLRDSYLEVEQGQGDSHERYGQWQAPDGRTYSYHANWRCGHIEFWTMRKE